MVPYEIHPKVLKKLCDVTLRPLSIIFQWSWNSGKVPIDWKLSNVTIFKKGNKVNFGNYWPFSLTSVPDKILEKLILGVFEKHTKNNVVISHSQHSFGRQKSCLTN